MFKKSKPEFNPVKEIQHLIDHAIGSRASDVHIEPFADFIRVRFRVDGVLIKHSVLPISKKEEITAILKVMATLDSTNKRGAQDGKIKYEYNDSFIEIRVSVLPFKYGEKIVLRIQNTDKVELKLEALDMDQALLEPVKKVLSAKQGLVLVTGSTGSGKTTTIYSALDYISSDELNIVTVEDPIEYDVEGFIQIQLSKELDMGYADVLKAVLRQDPDVLVIGEIRDAQTARIAVRAALTGHLVLASLHTNDAIDSIIRLVEMGIEPYLIATAVKIITYQRLVRELCKACKKPDVLSEEQAAILGTDQQAEVYFAAGCKKCSKTGYLGRKPVFEILIPDDEVIEILASSNKSFELRQRLRPKLHSTLLPQVKNKVLDGTTSFEEVAKRILL